jgi:hypothetical protein
MTPSQAKEGGLLAVLIGVLLVVAGGVLLWGFEEAVIGAIVMAVGGIGVFVTIPVSLQAAAASRTHERSRREGRSRHGDGAVIERRRLGSKPRHDARSS